jgi:hypothetical protein
MNDYKRKFQKYRTKYLNLVGSSPAVPVIVAHVMDLGGGGVYFSTDGHFSGMNVNIDKSDVSLDNDFISRDGFVADARLIIPGHYVVIFNRDDQNYYWEDDHPDIKGNGLFMIFTSWEQLVNRFSEFEPNFNPEDHTFDALNRDINANVVILNYDNAVYAAVAGLGNYQF